MRKKIRKIEDYREISADVWMIFKKYFPDDADMADFGEDIHKLDEKYKPDLRKYCFMSQLIRVYVDELKELKGLKHERTD